MAIDELKDLGVRIPRLTTYKLQPEKTMNSQELEIYNLVYNSSLIAFKSSIFFTFFPHPKKLQFITLALNM
jgi:hypothetical protein